MISDNIKKINQNISEAIEKSPTREDVFIVGVTKNHSVEESNDVIKNGISIVAENRVQAMREKYDFLLPCEKHLIGHLQTNKVKIALKMFDVIQSVDSDRLLREIDKEAGKLGVVSEILLQVNIAREEIKFGIFKESLPELLRLASELEHVKVKGLMSIMPIETKDKYYQDMYNLFIESKALKYKNIDLKFLSMGMSNDYITAITYGANMVRLGRCLFS